MVSHRNKQNMWHGVVTATATSWLLGICLLLGAAACTSSGSSSRPTVKPSGSASTTSGTLSCFEVAASGGAPAYVGLSLKDAESTAKARHDRLIVVEEEGTCVVRALPGYIGPSLTVEVALIDGKVAEARSIYPTFS